MPRERLTRWPNSYSKARPNVFIDLRYPRNVSEGFIDVRDPRYSLDKKPSSDEIVGTNNYKNAETFPHLTGNLVGNKNRELVTNIVHRNAVYVLGYGLASKAEAEMRGTVPAAFRDPMEAGTGTKVVHSQYAATIAALAAGMGWQEKSPPFQILCARLYEHEVTRRLQNVTDITEQQKILKIKNDITEAITAYIGQHPLTIDMDLLLKFLTVKTLGTARRRLLALLEKHRIADFFENLKSLTTK